MFFVTCDDLKCFRWLRQKLFYVSDDFRCKRTKKRKKERRKPKFKADTQIASQEIQ